jgi:nucleotide-binding universal stress UspA family protein
MFKNILVPLDGSELAEESLPQAMSIASSHESMLHLLQVVPLPGRRSGGAFKAAAAYLSSLQLPASETDLDMSRHPVYRESEMASLEAEAKGLLLPVAERIRAQGIRVEVAVAFGRPAGGILQYAKDHAIDLIVMSTHGEGGPDMYAFGPTADRVARRATVPVMLVRPEVVNRVLPHLPWEEHNP